MQVHGIGFAHDVKTALREPVLSPFRRNGPIGRAAHRCWCALVRAYLGAYHWLEVRGRQHIPARPPYVLVANHLNHLDALVLASALPGRLWDRVFPVAAEDAAPAGWVRSRAASAYSWQRRRSRSSPATWTARSECSPRTSAGRARARSPSASASR